MLTLPAGCSGPQALLGCMTLRPGEEAAGQGLLQKLADALKDRREVEFPVHDYRGITYVCGKWVRHLGGGHWGFPRRWFITFEVRTGTITLDTARLFPQGIRSRIPAVYY